MPNEMSNFKVFMTLDLSTPKPERRAGGEGGENKRWLAPQRKRKEDGLRHSEVFV